MFCKTDSEYYETIFIQLEGKIVLSKQLYKFQITLTLNVYSTILPTVWINFTIFLIKSFPINVVHTVNQRRSFLKIYLTDISIKYQN